MSKGFNMGGMNRNQMMQQARKMQEQLLAAQQKAAETEVSSTAGGGAVKGGLGQDLRHRPHAAGRHARGGLLVDVHDVAHDGAPREGHEHRCSHGRRGGKAVGHEVVVGRVYGAGRYVERDAGVAHGPSSLLVHLAGVCCRNLTPAGH